MARKRNSAASKLAGGVIAAILVMVLARLCCPTAKKRSASPAATSWPATWTPRPTVTSSVRSQPVKPQTDQKVCDCSHDRYNCSSFSSSQTAQLCYNYCRSLGHGDIHKLDRDGDGLACEK